MSTVRIQAKFHKNASSCSRYLWHRGKNLHTVHTAGGVCPCTAHTSRQARTVPVHLPLPGRFGVCFAWWGGANGRSSRKPRAAHAPAGRHLCLPYKHPVSRTQPKTGCLMIPFLRRDGVRSMRRGGIHAARRNGSATARFRVGLMFISHCRAGVHARRTLKIQKIIGAAYTVLSPANPAQRAPLPGGIYASPTNTRYRAHNPKPVARGKRAQAACMRPLQTKGNAMQTINRRRRFTADVRLARSPAISEGT